jgi:hypothetical protein
VSGPTRKLLHRSRESNRADGGQQRPIGGGEARSRSSSSENLQLASEHDRLEIALIDAAADEQTEQTTEEPIPQGQEHRPKSDP